MALLGAAAVIGVSIPAMDVDWPDTWELAEVLGLRVPDPDGTTIGHLQIQLWLGLYEMARLRPDPAIVSPQVANRILDLWVATAESETGNALLPHVRARNSEMIAWLQRCKAAGWRLIPPQATAADAPEGSPARLAEMAIQSLSFPDLHDAVMGLQWLYEHRPDLRPALAARLWAVLPSPEQWQLDPTKDMVLPRILLGTVAQAEFADEDAQRVIERVTVCITTIITKCGTLDVVWALWAVFACRCKRNRQAPAKIGGQPSFPESAAKALASRAAEPCDRNELRARFALLGLLTLLEIPVLPSAVSALGERLAEGPAAGAWWLCADQSFVTAWLVLRGIEAFRPLAYRQKASFLQKLLSAAEYLELDAADDYLRTLVRKERAKLDAARRGPPLRDALRSRQPAITTRRNRPRNGRGD